MRLVRAHYNGRVIPFKYYSEEETAQLLAERAAAERAAANKALGLQGDALQDSALQGDALQDAGLQDPPGEDPLPKTIKLPEGLYRGLRPYNFEGEEYINALIDEVMACYETCVASTVCYKPAVTLLDDNFVPEYAPAAIRERLKNTLYNTFSTIFGATPAERFGDVFNQVAYLFTHLAAGHVFPDGNKRTAIIVSLAFIYYAGYTIDVADSSNPSENFIYTCIQDLFHGDMDEDTFADLLRDHSKIVRGESGEAEELEEVEGSEDSE